MLTILELGWQAWLTLGVIAASASFAAPLNLLIGVVAVLLAPLIRPFALEMFGTVL